ncbi:MAG: hypothetical protein WDO16_18570 [Bacteroidota bacterium]
MKYLSNYRFLVGAITILSGILALLCMITGGMAVNYNFDAFSDPVLALNYSANHQLVSWFLLLDMFGYYLLLLPLIFYLHQQYKYRSPWTSLITFSGLAYVLIGAVGAAILAAVWPDMMQEHLTATSEQKEMIGGLFKAITLVVTKGMWNVIEMLFSAVWWIGIGKLLYRESKVLGALTMTTGISTLLDAAGNITGFHSLAEAGLNIYLLLAIVWAIVMGISIMRKTACSQSVPAKTVSASALKNQLASLF